MPDSPSHLLFTSARENPISQRKNNAQRRAGQRNRWFDQFYNPNMTFGQNFNVLTGRASQPFGAVGMAIDAGQSAGLDYSWMLPGGAGGSVDFSAQNFVNDPLLYPFVDGPPRSAARTSPNIESQRQRQFERQAFLDEANRKLNEASASFVMFQKLESENLSPEARAAVGQMREDAARSVNEINAQIQRYMTGIETFNDLSQQGRSLVEGQLLRSQDVVNASRSTADENLEVLTGRGVGAVEQASANATAEIVNSMGEAVAQSGQDPRYLSVFGGVENAPRRAELEAQATEGIRELENIVASNVASVGSLQQDINDASARAASAQLELVGITDAKSRLQAQTMLETSLRNSVYDLVQSRQTIERELERGIAALELEDRNARTAQIDELGLNIDPTPIGLMANQFNITLDEEVGRLGVDLTVVEAATFAADSETWLGLARNDPRRAELVATMAAKFGMDPGLLQTALQRAEGEGAIVAREAESWDENTSFTPGSTALAYGIYTTALELGWLPDDAAFWANSMSLHHLIGQQSGGRVGARSGATLGGIGGLSEDAYRQLGIDYAEIEGDVREELKALLLYVQAVYGNPRSALAASLDEGQFGVLPSTTVPVSSSANASSASGLVLPSMRQGVS